MPEDPASQPPRDYLQSKTRHDLLTPLNAIIGFSGIVLEKGTALDEKQKKNLQRVHEAGKRLLAMIQEIADASRGDEKGVERAPEPAPPPGQSERMASRMEAAKAALKGVGGKVLVVDDVESNRELLRQDLEGKGFTVASAGSGEEAIAKAREWEPACIILDIEMPGMDGLEACRRLKADSLTTHVPVLFLTGHAADETTAIAALAAGGNDFLQKPYLPSILLARVNSQVAIYEALGRLRKMVMTDELTGVFSRRFLFESLRQQIKALTRTGPPSVSVLMLDVDHFKKVNDTHGHLEGDQVLRAVAVLVRSCVRGSDIVARFGGEEFVAILPATRLPGALDLAERIRTAVESGTRLTNVPVTISIGVASSDVIASKQSDDSTEQELMDRLFKEADEALYKAKESGRNRVCQFEKAA